MPAQRHDLTIEQGGTWSQTLIYRSSVGGPAVDLSGYSARMQVRPTHSSDVVYLDLSTASGGISIDGPNGTITLSRSAAQTAALAWNEAVYDLEIVSSGGVVTRIMQGKMILSREVTR